MEKITKELRGKSGIYCIVNTYNLKKYVGSSKNIYLRLSKHRAYLRKNMHENLKLQNSWNEYGENYFQYYILEFCDEESLINRELFYINTLKPLFNITLQVERLTMSDETREKMLKSRLEGFKKGTVKLYLEKPIYQYSLSGEFIQEFKNIKQAVETLGISRTSINRYFLGKYKKGGNFLWSFTREEKLAPYQKPKRNTSYFNKPIEVTDITNNTTIIYSSLTEFSKKINKDYNSIRHAMIRNYPYLRKYMIKHILPCN